MIYIINVIKIEEKNGFPPELPPKKFINFLCNHLGEYGDKKADIQRALNYSFSNKEGKGGFVLMALKEKKIVGGVVVNDTGMAGYIPEHILVYIATHKEYRGNGIGTMLLEKVFQECSGDIALHVEYDNPAVRLYKKVGFSSKYAEMRYSQ